MRSARLRRVARHIGAAPAAETAERRPGPPSSELDAGADADEHRRLSDFFEPETGPVIDTALAELDARGYTVLRGMIDEAWLGELRQRFDELCDEEGPLGGLETMPEERQQELRASLLPGYEGEPPFSGIRRLGDLVNKGACFDRIWQNPTLISIVAGVLLAPFKLHSLNGHDPLPGQGQQNLHADWSPPPELQPRDPGLFGVVNSAWCLDEFTIEKGGTRLVPASHRVPGSTPSETADEEAVQVATPAGSVIIWCANTNGANKYHLELQIGRAEFGVLGNRNGSTWHGGCVNTTQLKRRAVHCAWLDRRYNQQTNQRQYLRYVAHSLPVKTPRANDAVVLAG